MLIERNLFSAVCSSGLLARVMSNGGNPFLEGHENLGRDERRKSKLQKMG